MQLYNNIVTEYLKQDRWRSLPDSERIYFLQQFELNLAFLQNRPARTIKLHHSGSDDREVLYLEKKPDDICLYCSPNSFKSMFGILQAGTAALIDDIAKKRVSTVNLVSDVDPDALAELISAEKIMDNYFRQQDNENLKKGYELLSLERQIIWYDSLILFACGLADFEEKSTQEEMTEELFRTAVNYYIERELVDREIGKYTDVEEKIPFEEYGRQFMDVLPVSINRHQTQILEIMFSNIVNINRNANGYPGLIDTRPFYSQKTVDNIKKAKKIMLRPTDGGPKNNGDEEPEIG